MLEDVGLRLLEGESRFLELQVPFIRFYVEHHIFFAYLLSILLSIFLALSLI